MRFKEDYSYRHGSRRHEAKIKEFGKSSGPGEGLEVFLFVIWPLNHTFQTILSLEKFAISNLLKYIFIYSNVSVSTRIGNSNFVTFSGNFSRHLEKKIGKIKHARKNKKAFLSRF